MFDTKEAPTVDFFPFLKKVVDVPHKVRKELSTGQGYLLKARLVVLVGRDSSLYTPFLECCQPSNKNHSRMLTKASRVLQVYVTDSCIKIIAETI